MESRKRAAWFLPMFLEGSGGHRTMFQNIQVLSDHGYVNDVYVENKGQVKNDAELRKQVEKYFGKYDCELYLGFDRFSGEYDAVFATAWFTAKLVRDLNTKGKKIYFIQDFEALFSPMGDGYLMAMNSYCYGLKPITIGNWLSHKMESEYNSLSHSFDFCADHKIYKRVDCERENAICFIYQPDKPRRCAMLGIEALGIVKHLRPDVKIYLYGSTMRGNVWFDHENLGIISLDKCNELYNKCKVGLCISSSNPSRIPFEMMTVGLPVVDIYMENNLYDMPDGGVLLAHYTPESIATAIIKIIDDEDLQRKMANAGRNYMKNKNLEYGYSQFYKAVENIINDASIEQREFYKTYHHGPVVADVVMEKLAIKEEQINGFSRIEKIKRALRHFPIIYNSQILRKIYSRIRNR